MEETERTTVYFIMGKNRGVYMRYEQQLVTSNSKSTQLVTSNKLTSSQIRERALTIAEGLTSTIRPNDMTGWYCKAYKLLGESKYTACVSMAKQPGVRNPKGLFGYLLKEELKNAK